MGAWEANLCTLPAQVAAANLSTKQFYIVKQTSGGVDVTSSKGEACVGVLQDNPESGRTANVAIGGISKCVAGEAITKGALVCAGANGKAFVASKGTTATNDAGAAADPLVGSYVIGHAVEAATAEDQLFPLLITHSGACTTTAA